LTGVLARPRAAVGRHRVLLLIAAAALVTVVLTVLTAGSQASYPAALDPANPDGNGAQALARVLDQQGVDVMIVRSADALDRAVVDAGTTIVVTSTGSLGTSTTQRLLSRRGAARLVLVGPGPGVVRALGLSAYPDATALPSPVTADCPTYDGLSLSVPRADEYDGQGCFPGNHGAVIGEPAPGITFLGAPAALTNDQILDGDNAAIALRLLGTGDRLVWYVPSYTDLAGADGISARSLLPRFLTPALWLTGLTGLALALWRGRRLGPLAMEPLPVVVKAVETTRSLGRLYRRSGDRGHAAAALRTSARVRMAERLRLPRTADPDRIVRAVAARTGRSEADVSALIGPGSPAPTTDRDLTALAHALAELDREALTP
jgi:Domain of unknown function (DUF4350)